jgi:hypothetical protein
MTNNEKDFVKSIVEHIENINKAQEYVQNNFNVKTRYDEESNTLNLWTTNINEALQIIAAKDYLISTIGEDMVTIKYGIK